MAGKRRDSVELRRSDHFVADQDVADAAIDHDLGLGYLLTANADGAGGDLHIGDRGALVGLGVRPQPKPGSRDALLHAADVALERIELDQQRGRIDLGDVRTNSGRRRYHALPRTDPCSACRAAALAKRRPLR